jgi:hypothetical protein
MNFTAFVHDRLVIARLHRADIATSQAIARLVEDQHQRLGDGEGVTLILIIGTDCPMPEPAARRQLAEDQARLHRCCADMRTLILGGEMRQSLVRSLVAGFAMLPSRPRPTIDGSLDELGSALERSCGLEPSWLRTQLIDAGLLTTREVGARPVDQLVTS